MPHQKIRVITEIIEPLSIKERENFANLLKKNDIHLNVYKNPTGVSVGLVPVETREGIFLLSVIRNILPCVGGTALPGGFVEQFETFEDAAAREIYEETGINLNASNFTLSHSRVTPQNNLIVFCKYDRAIGEKDIDFSFSNSETKEILLCSSKAKYCFPTHQEASDLFFNV